MEEDIVMDTLEKIVQELDGIRRGMERDLEQFRAVRKAYQHATQRTPSNPPFFAPVMVGETLLSAKEMPPRHGI